MSLTHPQRAQLPVTLLPISPLKVPRRSTLCATVRTPELPARVFDASLSTHAASAPPATRRYTEIAPRKTPAPSSAARPKIRPLPNPPLSPGPKSAPPHTGTPRRQTSTSSFRPLPRVPEAGAVSVSVTPASPVDPPLPVIRSQTHLFPPPGTVVALPRFASLSLRLDTSPDALEPRRSPPHAAASKTEPPPPSGPVLPSPATARRRRMSKLRRHLGESVQILFTDAEEKREFGDVCSQTAVAVRKLLELDAADDDDSDTDTDDEEDGYSLVLAHGDAHCAIPLKRYSTKWIREQGSRQFVEENWSNILRDLRAL